MHVYIEYYTLSTALIYLLLDPDPFLVLNWQAVVGCRLLRRLATLLSQQATLMASNEAFKKQAEGASTAAKKYMEDNELLQEVTLPTTWRHRHTEHHLMHRTTLIQ